MSTTPIVTELKSFFAGHQNVSLSALSRKSGVNIVYISRLMQGGRKDIASRFADALRKAMREWGEDDEKR